MWKILKNETQEINIIAEIKESKDNMVVKWQKYLKSGLSCDRDVYCRPLPSMTTCVLVQKK